MDHRQLVLEARRIRLPVGRGWRQALVVIGPLPAWANEMLELLSEVVITQAGERSTHREARNEKPDRAHPVEGRCRDGDGGERVRDPDYEIA